MAKIIIKWKKQFCGSACKFDVYLMNTYIGELKCGTTLETTAEVGSSKLFFKQKNWFGNKLDTSFEVVINDDTEIVELKTKVDMNGCFVVSYADNAPHVLLGNNNVSENKSTNTDNTKNEINQTLSDIKKEAKKTNGCLGGCLTFIIIIFLMGLISSVILRDSVLPDVAAPAEQTSKENEQENQNNNAKNDNVLYSDDNFKITFVNLVDPKSGITMYNMNLKLENNSDKNVSIYLSEAYVNDVAIEFLGGNTHFDGIAPGKKSVCAFMFGYANHDISSIDDVKKIEFKITLRNSDKFSDVLLSTDTITINFN